MTRKNRFKLTISDVCCGVDGHYFTDTRIAFGKSPKECHERINRYGQHQFKSTSKTNYAGTPVLQHEVLSCGAKILKDWWD